MKDIFPITTIAFLILTAMINIAFAFGVYRVATEREQHTVAGNLFVSAVVWTMATLVGGVFVATAYWLIHLSSLSNFPKLSHTDEPSDS